MKCVKEGRTYNDYFDKFDHLPSYIKEPVN